MSIAKIISASASFAISDPSRIEKRPADVEQFQENLIEGRIVAAQRDFIDLVTTDAANKQEKGHLTAQEQNATGVSEPYKSTAAAQSGQAATENSADSTQSSENAVENQSHAVVTAYMASTNPNQASAVQDGRVSTKA